MEFKAAEVIFYTAIFIGGVIGGLCRHWRDYRGPRNVYRSIGRILSSGLLAFGIVGIWVGDDSSSINGPFYFVSAAALIGYLCPSDQDELLKRIMQTFYGGKDKPKDG